MYPVAGEIWKLDIEVKITRFKLCFPQATDLVSKITCFHGFGKNQ